MPRRPRVVLAGVPPRLIQRGNNRSVCFFAERDYQAYLGLGRRVTPGRSGRPSNSEAVETLELFEND